MLVFVYDYSNEFIHSRSLIFSSFVHTTKHYRVKRQEAMTELYVTQVGGLQSIVLGSVSFFLYTAEIPTTYAIFTVTLADNTVVMFTHRYIFPGALRPSLQKHKSNVT